MLIDRKKLQQAQETYQLDELTELKEVEATQAVLLDQQKEQAEACAKLKLSFLDCTHDLLQDLFPTPDQETLQVLQCYMPLKEDYKEKLSELIKFLTTTLEEKNVVRLQKVTSFEKSIYLAEKESEDEALSLVKRFYQEKKIMAKTKTDDSEHVLLKNGKELHYNLIQNELKLQECLDEAIDEFEAQMADSIKFMAEKGADFFKQFEDLEKMFHTGLLEGGMSEYEAFQTNQEQADADSKKAAILSNREEIQSTIMNLNEAHALLIANKDDYMQNSMNSWLKSTFDNYRERQYRRNRNRIQEAKTLLREIGGELLITPEIENVSVTSERLSSKESF